MNEIKISDVVLVNNNLESPKEDGKYFVMYSDDTYGFEYFNGNYWEVKYCHPVKCWEKKESK